MRKPKERIAALKQRVEQLEGEVARLRPVADAAKRWHLATDHLPVAHVAESSTGDLQAEIERLMQSEDA